MSTSEGRRRRAELLVLAVLFAMASLALPPRIGATESPGSTETSEESSSIELFAETRRVDYGELLRVWVLLNPKVDTTIEVNFTSPQGRNVTKMVDQFQAGDLPRQAFSGMFVVVVPTDVVGLWRVQAHWPGNGEYPPARSDVMEIQVVRASTQLDMRLQGNATVGETVNATVWLLPQLSDVEVTLFYRPSGSADWEEFTRAVLSGGRAELTFSLLQVGSFEFVVEWRGNENYTSARSRVRSLEVREIEESSRTGGPWRQVERPPSTAGFDLPPGVLVMALLVLLGALLLYFYYTSTDATTTADHPSEGTETESSPTTQRTLEGMVDVEGVLAVAAEIATHGNTS